MDKRCQIEVGLRQRSVRVEDMNADLFTAVDHAADRVSRSVARALERQRHGSTITISSTSGSSRRKEASFERARSSAWRTPPSAARSIGSRRCSAKSSSPAGDDSWCSRRPAASPFLTPTRSSRWGASSSTRSGDGRAVDRCGWSSASPTSFPRRSCGGSSNPHFGSATPFRSSAAQTSRSRSSLPSWRSIGWTSSSPMDQQGPAPVFGLSAICSASAARLSSPPRSSPPRPAATFRARSMEPRFSFLVHRRRCAVHWSSGSTPRISSRGSSLNSTTAHWQGLWKRRDGCVRGPHGHRARSSTRISRTSGGAVGGGSPAILCLSVERKIKHPAVAAVCEAARKDIFAH